MRSNTAVRAQIVRTRVVQGEAGLFYAISPDLKGLLVGRPTTEALERAIPQAIIDLYAACGEGVVVSRLDAVEVPEEEAWVAFPAEVARQALRSLSEA